MYDFKTVIFMYHLINWKLVQFSTLPAVHDNKRVQIHKIFVAYRKDPDVREQGFSIVLMNKHRVFYRVGTVSRFKESLFLVII